VELSRYLSTNNVRRCFILAVGVWALAFSMITNSVAKQPRRSLSGDNKRVRFQVAESKVLVHAGVGMYERVNCGGGREICEMRCGRGRE
jgi:hypothetical protein